MDAVFFTMAETVIKAIFLGILAYLGILVGKKFRESKDAKNKK